MMTFRVILRNGVEFSVIAENLETSRNTLTGKLASVSCSNIKHNKPCYLDLDEIVAIVRVVDDEEV